MKRILFTTFFILSSIALLNGCEDRYRYPCQDPENWNTEQCKKPYCDGDQTCPEDVSSVKKQITQKPTINSTPVVSSVCK